MCVPALVDQAKGAKRADCLGAEDQLVGTNQPSAVSHGVANGVEPRGHLEVVGVCELRLRACGATLTLFRERS